MSEFFSALTLCYISIIVAFFSNVFTHTLKLKALPSAILQSSITLITPMLLIAALMYFSNSDAVLEISTLFAMLLMMYSIYTNQNRR